MYADDAPTRQRAGRAFIEQQAADEGEGAGARGAQRSFYQRAITRQGPPEPNLHGIRPTYAVAPRGGIVEWLRMFSSPYLSAPSSVRWVSNVVERPWSRLIVSTAIPVKSVLEQPLHGLRREAGEVLEAVRADVPVGLDAARPRLPAGEHGDERALRDAPVPPLERDEVGRHHERVRVVPHARRDVDDDDGDDQLRGRDLRRLSPVGDEVRGRVHVVPECSQNDHRCA